MEELREASAARLEELARAVSELQRRVGALEQGSYAPQLEAGSTGEPAIAVLVGAGEASAEMADSVVPLLGWGLLGIAGAYLLRALTESGTLPGLAGAGLGIVYAAFWLYLAARRASEKPLFSAVHGLTAALILSPMLWETTVRFHLIPLPAASAVLICFAVLGLAIGWRSNVTAVAWTAMLAGLVTASAMFRETHDVTTWAVTLLLMAIAVEFSACRDHWLGLRWIVAMAADLAVLMVMVLANRTPDPAQIVASPSVSVVLGLQIGLLTIYLASTIARTIFRDLSITGFEIGQAMLAFAISIGGALQIAGASNATAVSVGLFCLLAGAACYLVSFATLDHRDERNRNFYTYSTFALLLTLLAGKVLLGATALAAACSLLAVGALALGFMRDRNTLRVHSSVYLLLAVAVSGMLQQATSRVIRAEALVWQEVAPAYIFAFLGAVFCYAVIVTLGKRAVVRWTDLVECIMAAGLVCWGAAGLVAGWLYVYVSGAAPLRTALLTALSIAAAWAGQHWKRRELAWLAYPLLGLAGLKLIAEDFPQGRSLTLFASLIFFGGGLIILPRLMQRRRPAHSR